LYFHDEFYALLRAHRMAFVIADSAGRFPMAEVVTAPFVYVRLHGSTELYVSGYTDAELEEWAARVDRWARAGSDVYVYFDNDAKVHAPRDAIRLRQRLDAPLGDVHFDERPTRQTAPHRLASR
jgi:uncharacterized protein YecE (DUF72 family)